MHHKQTNLPIFIHRLKASLYGGVMTTLRLISMFLLLSETGVGGAEPATQLELIPFPDAVEEDWFHDMAVDESGVVWVIANYRLYRIEGREFVQPFPKYQSFLHLIGGADRGLFAAMSGKDKEGRLLRLRDGTANEIGTYYQNYGSRERSMHVSRSGIIITWGERFLSARNNDGEWNRIETRLSETHTRVFDVGENTFVYYDNLLYSVDSKGRIQARECPQWESPRSGQETIKGALWGDTRVLLVNIFSGNYLAFDLTTGKPIDLAPALAPLGSLKFSDVFSLKNGDVWLLTGEKPNVDGYRIYLLTKNGKLTELPGIGRISPKFNAVFSWSNDSLAMELAGGEILLSGTDESLAVYRNSRLERWGWREGIRHRIQNFIEAPDRAIWFPMERNIVRMRLAAGPPPLSGITPYWQEFRLAGMSQIWPLAPGVVGLFRSDIPDSFSRWNGHEWSHQKVPFKPTALRNTSAVDDKGRLIVWPFAGPSAPLFVIGQDTVQKLDSIDAVLEKAVADGVRQFPFTAGFAGITVTQEGKIWYGISHRSFYGNIRVFDGKTWSDVPTDKGFLSIQESLHNGMLFKNEAGVHFFRQEGGQLVELKPEFPTVLMFNDRGFWPYEKGIVDRDPDGNAPAIMSDRRFIALSHLEDLEAAAKALIDPQAYAEATLLTTSGTYTYRYMKRSLSGGGWIYRGFRENAPVRLLAGSVRKISFEGTPLSRSIITDIVEDGSGGLWFLKHSGHATAYCYTLPTVSITSTTPHQKSGRELRLDLSLATDRPQENIELFQRIDSGPWQSIDKGKFECLFQFSKKGRHRCEVAAFEYGAKLSDSFIFEVDVEIDQLTAELANAIAEPLTVDEIFWHPPVVIRDANTKAQVELLWSADGTPWQPVSKDDGALLVGLKPGQHLLKFTVREAGLQNDPPLEVKIDFRPDYEKFVDQWLPRMLDPDMNARNNALTIFGNVVPHALPALQSRLEESRKAEKMTRALEGIISEIGAQK